MARTYPWKVSDAMWERVEPLIPVRPPHPKGGRPAADDPLSPTHLSEHMRGGKWIIRA